MDRIGKPTAQPIQKAQNQPTRSLFDDRLSSAIKITDINIDRAKKLLTQKVTEGWRWVSEGFINDKNYQPERGYFTHYHVKTSKSAGKPDPGKFHDADIILTNKVFTNDEREKRKHFFYMNSDGVVMSGNCSAKWDAQDLEDDFNRDIEGFDLRSNPVLKARQMPELEDGDWIAIQGKTLRLIKASDQVVIKKLQKEWKHADVFSEEKVKGIGLTEEYFKDSYARLAGAYIRRLERQSYLKDVFELFFKKEIIREPIEVFLASGGGERRSCGKFACYHKITLKNVALTTENLPLLKKALGVDIETIADLNDESTIENTIPFKKVLEIFTFYNKGYNYPNNVPILVHFDISANVRGKGTVHAPTSVVNFLLNVEQGNPNQLIISSEGSGGVYVGNAYSYWLKQEYSPDAVTADKVLNRPFAESKDDIRGLNNKTNLIEFLACTQIVESHATPGNLMSSRVPSSAKHARAFIRKAKDERKLLAEFFNVNNIKKGTEFFPLAANGGTANGRDGVNTLTRSERQIVSNQQGKIVNVQNAPDYDLSEDSDVEW